MARILVLHGAPRARARLVQAVRDAPVRIVDFTVESAESWHELEVMILRWPDGVVVFDPYFGGRFQSRSIQRMLSAFAGLHAFIAYASWRSDATRDVLQLGHWGVREIATLDVDDSPGRLSRIITLAWRQSGVLRALGPQLERLPREVRDALEVAVASPRDLTVSSLARRLGLTTRTLQRHFLAARVPTPQTVVARCKLLHAARLLATGRVSVQKAASVLLYADAASLRRAFVRHYGVTVTQARAIGYLEILAVRLLRRAPREGDSVGFEPYPVAIEPPPLRDAQPSLGLVALQGD